MIRTYFDFVVEQKINELMFLVEKIDESTSDDSQLKTKMSNFIKFALSKGQKIGLPIINFFLEKIRKNKKATFVLLSILFFSAGLSLNTLFGELALTSSEQDFVKGLSIQGTEGIEGSPIEPYELKDKKDSISTLSKEQSLQIQKIIDDHIKKGFKVVDPKTIGFGKYFDKKKTMFTSAEFPYKVNNNSTKGVFFKYENQVDLLGTYIYELDKAASGEKIGLKLLALSMTYMEGFIKETSNGDPSTSYLTKNPGNIGNTDSKERKFCGTLKEGIDLQINYIKRVAMNQHSQYPIGEIKFHAPYYSGDLERVVPGYIFVYEGTLEQYLKIYATGARDNNEYLNVVLTFFETYSPTKITPKTKIKDIINIGDNGRLIDLITDNYPDILKSMAGEMLSNGYTVKEISNYTGLPKDEVRKCKPRSKRKRSTKSKPLWDIFGFQ